VVTTVVIGAARDPVDRAAVEDFRGPSERFTRHIVLGNQTDDLMALVAPAKALRSGQNNAN
jgi:hypothetical protein